MIGLFAFLIFIFCLLLYLLFAPVCIEINSIKGLYQMRFHRIASMNIKHIDNTLLFDIKIIGWKRTFDLFTNRTINKEKILTTKRRSKKQTPISWRRVRNVLLSFKIRKCYISVDTGNNQLNGILYPLFYMAGKYSGKNIKINFIEENEIILKIDNNLARMSWAFLSS